MQGGYKRLTCEKSTCTNHLAENPEQANMSCQTDTFSNDTDSCVSINLADKFKVPSKTDTLSNVTDSSVSINPSSKFNMSCHTDTSGEKTDGSHCRFVCKDCQRMWDIFNYYEILIYLMFFFLWTTPWLCLVCLIERHSIQL